MKLYRVELVEYDYSPTLGIFDSLEKAEQCLKSLGAIFGLEDKRTKREPYWFKKTRNYTNLYSIYVSELNGTTEERLV